MNPPEFILALVFMVFMFSLLKHRMGVRHRWERPETEEKSVENERLRGQVQQLQERIRVLERIVTDRGVETAAQIEALRDRDRITEEDRA
jgi:uncharacterized protein YlxW (UPF0749 family)